MTNAEKIKAIDAEIKIQEAEMKLRAKHALLIELADQLSGSKDRIAELEKDESDLINQRDHCEEIIDRMADAVLGKDRPEWSSNYDFIDAAQEVEDRVAELQEKAAAQQAGQAAVPEAIEQMAADRYKVVPSHESMFHRWAVVADNGAQQLYIGREGECQNMARKFMGAFLDGAFVAMQNAAPAHPAEGVPAQAGTYAEARECVHCNHVGINDSAEGVATCVACQWIGDSPKEDKCPDCEAEGTMTASCPKCHHEYRLIADATLAATQPAPQAQADARDVERWMGIGKAIERACADLPEETEIVVSLEKDAGTVTLIDQDGNEHENFSCDYGFAGVLNEAIDAAIAEQTKQGEQANG